MKNLLFVMLLSFCGSVVFAQEVKVQYFKDRFCSKETSESKANFVQTTTTFSEGGYMKSVTRVSDNKIISAEGYKNDEPIGKWVIERGSGYAELDYNFEMGKEVDICDGKSDVDSGANVDDDSLGLKVEGYDSFNEYLWKNVFYPWLARENGQMGTVYLNILVNATGEIEQVALQKSSGYKSLDKEAMRVTRGIPISRVDYVKRFGKRACFRFPMKFSLR